MLNTKDTAFDFSFKLTNILFSEKCKYIYSGITWSGENKLLNRKRTIASEFSTKNKIKIENFNKENNFSLVKLERGLISNPSDFNAFIFNYQLNFSSNLNLLFEFDNEVNNLSIADFGLFYFFDAKNNFRLNYDMILEKLVLSKVKLYLMDSDLEYGSLKVIKLIPR